ncbi:MAG: hypothetical protein QF515_11170 [Pseudomonadales bacterium]|jgi:glutathione S-transferase|nr:hypothetical protein [Pseudomonadales bacterium]MDP6827652.1 hypothetical protein [Pseudomonadales bacterium]|tara:strand:- start:584 stop:751 length:168 start_codon:yes stop_codon:yes gene_type:complete
MFAPVILRFRTYGVDIPADIAPYVRTALTDADLKRWITQAQRKPWTIAAEERGSV